MSLCPIIIVAIFFWEIEMLVNVGSLEIQHLIRILDEILKDSWIGFGVYEFR